MMIVLLGQAKVNIATAVLYTDTAQQTTVHLVTTMLATFKDVQVTPTC